MSKKYLVTGAAGFIGFHLSKRLLESGVHVVGVDNLNDYYDVNLKKARLQQLQDIPNFRFLKVSLEEKEKMLDMFKTERFDTVVNLDMYDKNKDRCKKSHEWRVPSRHGESHERHIHPEDRMDARFQGIGCSRH